MTIWKRHVSVAAFLFVVCASACNSSIAAEGKEAGVSQVVALENEHLRIAIDAGSGAVIGVTNRKTGTDYVRPQAEPAPPFVVDVYSANQAIYIRDPFEKQTGGFSLYNPESDADLKGDLSRLRSPVANGVKVEKRSDAESERVVCSFLLPGGIHVAYSITVRRDSPITEWRARVENRGGQTPNDDRRVYRLAFPVIEGLCIGPAHRNFLARPYAQGELIPDPASYSFRRPGRQSHVPIHVLTYIGWASMSWMDLYHPERGGLYLASYDTSFQQVDLESWPNRASGTMTLDMRTYAFLEPGQSWDSQPFAVAVHEGDWHWAADRYREWVRANHLPYSGPEWVRNECDGWFGTGGPVPYDTYPAMLEDARWLGLDYLQIWSEMLENVGPDKSRKAYYCFLMPDPDRGGEEGIAKAVQEVRKAGGHIGFYHNVWTWDSEVEKGLQQWRDRIPNDVKIPRWWGDFRRSASVFPDGSRAAGNFTDGYAGMCPASREYQDYILFWVVDRYVKRYGADAWYFDSMPVTMFGASRVCFSGEHGPEQPHGVGRGILELLRRVSERVGPAANLAITCETVNDAIMQYNSHALGIELVEGLTSFPRPEIYTYTFPEHAVFSGTCNGAGSGLPHYYPDMEQWRREDAMNRVFLMGYRFDVLFGRVDRNNPFHQYMRSLIALRQKIKADLYGSDFRDAIGLGGLPERVEAKLFRRRDGGSMTVALLDRRKNGKAPFALELDAAKHAFPAASAATLFSFRGDQKDLPVKAAAGGILSVEVPPLDGEVAAIILRPAE